VNENFVEIGFPLLEGENRMFVFSLYSFTYFVLTLNFYCLIPRYNLKTQGYSQEFSTSLPGIFKIKMFLFLTALLLKDDHNTLSSQRNLLKSPGLRKKSRALLDNEV
jgi:hypothetical protein